LQLQSKDRKWRKGVDDGRLGLINSRYRIRRV
jgi:hypothetical protein